MVLTLFFLSDCWLHCFSIIDLAPLVISHVTHKIINTQTVPEVLNGQLWTQDICGSLSVEGFFEYFQLWDTEDRHIWVHDSSGVYTCKSAYTAYFQGSITFEPWKRLWKSWAPGKCKTFLWLAIRKACTKRTPPSWTNVFYVIKRMKMCSISYLLVFLPVSSGLKY
jgi:hypothetical protein